MRKRRTLPWNWAAAAELYRAGWSYPRIGKHLGIHHTNVMRVLKSRSDVASRPVGRPSLHQANEDSA